MFVLCPVPVYYCIKSTNLDSMRFFFFETRRSVCHILGNTFLFPVVFYFIMSFFAKFTA